MLAIKQSLTVTGDSTTSIQPITIQDINDTLDYVAGLYVFSSPDYYGAAQPG